jgi:hypothetical protein
MSSNQEPASETTNPDPPDSRTKSNDSPKIKTMYDELSKRVGSLVARSSALNARKHLTIGAKSMHGSGDCYRNERSFAVSIKIRLATYLLAVPGPMKYWG